MDKYILQTFGLKVMSNAYYLPYTPYLLVIPITSHLYLWSRTRLPEISW